MSGDTKKNIAGALTARPISDSSPPPVPTKKIIIKSADMMPDVQKEAIDIAVAAFEKYNVEKEVAAQIKKEFDKRHGPTWHCIVGRNFGELGDDGNKVKISTTSAAAPEQDPHHRPTAMATTPKPPEPINNSIRVAAVATREEEKEQESDACHPDQRCGPKLQDNSVGWGKINSIPWVKKGSTRKKKKPPPHFVWVACEKKQKARSMAQFQRFGQVGDLMGHAAVLMGQAQLDKEKQWASKHKMVCITTFTKLQGRPVNATAIIPKCLAICSSNSGTQGGNWAAEWCK